MPILRPVYSEQEIAEVVRLAGEIWPEHYLPIIGHEQIDYMLEKFQSREAIREQIGKSFEYFLVEHQGRNTGYLAVVANANERTMLLSKFYVKKSERGRGLGRKALEFVVGLCRERGIRTIWLTVNKHNLDSIEWYQRMGFKNVGPTVQDIGHGFVMDDFRMEMGVE